MKEKELAEYSKMDNIEKLIHKDQLKKGKAFDEMDEAGQKAYIDERKDYHEKKGGKPEHDFILRNRPFHVFEVKQISYKAQYIDYYLSVDDLNLLCVLG